MSRRAVVSKCREMALPVRTKPDACPEKCAAPSPVAGLRGEQARHPGIAPMGEGRARTWCRRQSAAMLYFLMNVKQPAITKAYYDNLASGFGLSRETAQRMRCGNAYSKITARARMPGSSGAQPWSCSAGTRSGASKPCPAIITWKNTDVPVSASPRSAGRARWYGFWRISEAAARPGSAP